MTRAVPITDEQASFLEELGFELMRAGDHERASRLLAVFVAWKISPEVPPLRLREAFRCEPDESAGMAEVVELHGWSRKAPCA